MGVAADILDYLAETAVPTALTGLNYVEIPESIELEENSDLFYYDGFAVFMGEDDATQGTIKSQTDIITLFGVTLVKHVSARRTDASGLREVKKELKDEAELVWKYIHETDPCMNGLVLDSVYTTSSPVEFLGGDDFRFYILSLNFEVRYIE